MTDVLTLPAEARAKVGKGASRAMRRQGRVPAVIYGGGQPPLPIAIEERLLVKQLAGGRFMNSVIDIAVGDTVHRTIPRDVQFHVVTDRPIHADFLRVSEASTVTVLVPVRFVHEEACPGLKRGGVLNVVRHEIELQCPAEAIPDDITVDLAGFDLGQSIHISAVTLPPRVRPTIERDFTIATIVAPSGLKAEEAAEGASGQG
ncbi:MAG: 50S ribosomal protein L25/general stress protein Ctc [Sphingomonadaceae bacterium]|uniref:50S ribosomal protein L25/general stress protein Ctc n=1 Tax=Thermaurantiacus sp. TaxID=2820283 RepID=UPI00298EED49|nr:50S ribosomal protein L25/general stress protein Ctc [Thermaurantiacus sp.]MCS6987862.1 50S ribosomal protein L25/general stress protein Ctc [Sphingomonadaceae bacterium]MDW8414918.1 50S ribosomal protein L25/general stress protein Ctc [Thermaurantiacus sp.]